MSLRGQLQELTGMERASNAQQKLIRENQTLMAKNAQLREVNLCLNEEAYRLKQNNGCLQQVMECPCCYLVFQLKCVGHIACPSTLNP